MSFLNRILYIIFVSKEALNKSILDLSEHAIQKCDFCIAHKFNDLSSSNLEIHPCITGTSDLIRGSLIVYSKYIIVYTVVCPVVEERAQPA